VQRADAQQQHAVWRHGVLEEAVELQVGGVSVKSDGNDDQLSQPAQLHRVHARLYPTPLHGAKNGACSAIRDDERLRDELLTLSSKCTWEDDGARLEQSTACCRLLACGARTFSGYA